MAQRMIRIVIFIAVIVLAGACANAQEEAMPTLLVIPSATPTETPLPTETPTDTPPSTATMTFTPSETPTTTSSPTATTTTTATLTWTPSITATFTLTSSPTATATFTQTATPTATNTPVGPVINLFNASATQAAPGTQVTLRWDTTSTIARIERLDAQGAILETFGNLPATSSLVVTVPSGMQQVVYRLVANLNGVETSTSLPITITCGQTWFFANPPADAGCPEGPSEQVSGAFQSFQTGFMVHLIIPAKSINRVFGAQNEGFQYLGYQNQWDGVTIVAGTPPAGFLEPQGIFNWMFYNKLASGGTWELKVGWATNNIDNSTRTVQFAQNGTMYFNTPLGVYRFNGNPAAAGTQSSGTWQKIN